MLSSAFAVIEKENRQEARMASAVMLQIIRFILYPPLLVFILTQSAEKSNTKKPTEKKLGR